MIDWDSHVNKDVYGVDSSYSENTEDVSFKSGRRVSHLKNTLPRKSFSVTMRFDDSTVIDGNTEFRRFLAWFESDIKSGTLSFSFPDISERGAGEREYRITEPPTWTGQRYKTVSMTFEEV